MSYTALNLKITSDNVGLVWTYASQEDDFFNLILRGRCIKFVNDNLYYISRNPALTKDWDVDMVTRIIGAYEHG